MIARVGDYTVEFSVEETRKYYETAVSGSESCGCIYCRNFAAQRDMTFGDRAREFLAQFGVDWRKEGEVVEYGRVASGLRLYTGEFAFVGHVVEHLGTKTAERIDEVEYSFAKPIIGRDDPRIDGVCFSVELPWALDEPEPQ